MHLKTIINFHPSISSSAPPSSSRETTGTRSAASQTHAHDSSSLLLHPFRPAVPGSRAQCFCSQDSISNGGSYNSWAREGKPMLARGINGKTGRRRRRVGVRGRRARRGPLANTQETTIIYPLTNTSARPMTTTKKQRGDGRRRTAAAEIVQVARQQRSNIVGTKIFSWLGIPGSPIKGQPLYSIFIILNPALEQYTACHNTLRALSSVRSREL